MCYISIWNLYASKTIKDTTTVISQTIEDDELQRRSIKIKKRNMSNYTNNMKINKKK